MDQDDKAIRLRYESIPTPMVDSSDTPTIDNDIFAETTIAYLAI